MMKNMNTVLKTLFTLILFINIFGTTKAQATCALASIGEICGNRIDDDGDGLIDCMDSDCADYFDCWNCSTDMYQVHSNAKLVKLDPAIGTYTEIATISGASQVNGAQFNIVDGHVYAPAIIDGNHVLATIAPDGTVSSTGLSLPGTGVFYVGAIDANGSMYISNNLGIHKIALNIQNLVVEDLGVPHPGVADFSLDITRNLFYGISGGKKLVVFNPTTLEVYSYDLAGDINNESGGFGAAWSSVDGSFYAYNNNSGKIFSVDVTNLTATQVINATGNLTTNDGFNCVNAAPPFESNCGNATDDDGDGLIDCDDPDCFNSNQCTVEICDNGIDDDNDGWTDCNDSECYSLQVCIEICDNGIDDNNNGLIDGDDPQCNTSPAVFGGLESNRRLSQKIASRNFKIKKSKPAYIDQKVEGLIPFQTDLNRSGLDIKDLIPTNFMNAYVAESSPEDIVGITNAIDVAGADYYINNQRVATILGMYSTGGVYEHTKYICDRLEGARLLDISYIYNDGGNFISYEMINKNGQKEYAISYSAFLNENGFNVESHWNLHKFEKNVDYYNFQIWASSYDQLIELLDVNLKKLKEYANIYNYSHSAIPRVFIMHTNYENGKLKLLVKNKMLAKSITLNGSVRKTETGILEEKNIEIALSGNSEELLQVDAGKFYDLGASIIANGSASDEIFVADGAWGIDTENPNAVVEQFDLSSESTPINENEYHVERNINVTAKVKDYLSIYRSLDAKFNPQNLSNYNSLSFEASGNCNLEITLVKSSVEEWTQQYKTNISLNPEIVNHTVHFETLVSTLQEQFDPTDINMIVFTIIGDNANFTDIELNIKNVKFENNTISANNEIAIVSNATIYPSPATEFINIKLIDDSKNVSNIEMYTETGKKINITKNLNENYNSKIQLSVKSLNPGLYLCKVNYNDGSSQTGKFIKIN